MHLRDWPSNEVAVMAVARCATFEGGRGVRNDILGYVRIGADQDDGYEQ